MHGTLWPERHPPPYLRRVLHGALDASQDELTASLKCDGTVPEFEDEGAMHRGMSVMVAPLYNTFWKAAGGLSVESTDGLPHSPIDSPEWEIAANASMAGLLSVPDESASGTDHRP